eukprot:1194408-Prorocentrum_minimum.AAC.2
MIGSPCGLHRGWGSATRVLVEINRCQAFVRISQLARLFTRPASPEGILSVRVSLLSGLGAFDLAPPRLQWAQRHGMLYLKVLTPGLIQDSVEIRCDM